MLPNDAALTICRKNLLLDETVCVFPSGQWDTGSSALGGLRCSREMDAPAGAVEGEQGSASDWPELLGPAGNEKCRKNRQRSYRR